MRVNPGELNKKIRILKPYDDSITKDSDGFPIKSEVLFHECWAKVSNISGKELIKSGADFSEVKTRFMIRYTPKNITTDMIINFNGAKYNIRYINNYGFSDEYIEIIAEVVRL